MKAPVKQYILKPSKTTEKNWYPYHSYDKNEIVFLEYTGNDVDDDLRTVSKMSISEINECIELIVERYDIDPDDISINSIVLEDEETTIEFSFLINLSDIEYQRQLDEYNSKVAEQERLEAEYKKYTKAKKVEELKKQLEKLERS